MSYVCEQVQTVKVSTETGLVYLQTCSEWQEHSFLPQLTDIDRDALIQFSLEIFLMVFVYVMIRKLF